MDKVQRSANMLKPALTKGDLKVVAPTTWEEYRKYFEKDLALMRRFQRVTVDESNAEVTNDILNGIKKYYEDYRNQITQDAIDEAIKLSVKYSKQIKKLIKPRFIRSSMSQDLIHYQKVEKKIVTADNVPLELAKAVNLPTEQVAERETENC